MRAGGETVVGQVDDRGVVDLALGGKRLHQLPDHVVDGLQGAQGITILIVDVVDDGGGEPADPPHVTRFIAHIRLVEGRRTRRTAGGEQGGVTGGGPGQVMGCVGRDHEEERLVVLFLGLLQVLEGLGGKEIGLVLARRRPEVAAVLVVSEVRIGLRLGEGEPIVPARWLDRPARAVAVGVLPDVGGPVAPGLEPDGEGVGFHAAVPILAVAAEGSVVAADTMIVRVATGHQGGTRRSAQGRGGNRVREGHSLGGHQRLQERHVARAHLLLVIGHDHNNVQRLGRRRGDRLRGGRRRRRRRCPRAAGGMEDEGGGKGEDRSNGLWELAHSQDRHRSLENFRKAGRGWTPPTRLDYTKERKAAHKGVAVPFRYSTAMRVSFPTCQR